MKDIDGIESILIYSYIIVLLALGIFTLVWFSIWIYYSWIKRVNSANLTGAEFSKLFIETNGGINKKFRGQYADESYKLKIKSSFLFLTPYENKRSYFSLKLLPWIYYRRSVYTLALALESSWAVSGKRSSKFNTYWWEFYRKWSLFFIIVPFIIPLFIGNSPFVLGVVALLSVIVFFLISFSQLAFYYRLSRDQTLVLTGVLSKSDIKAIRLIIAVKFIYYLARTLLEIIRIIWIIYSVINKKNK